MKEEMISRAQYVDSAGNCRILHYAEVASTVTAEDGGTLMSYGVRITGSDGEEHTVCDLSPDRDAVRAFIRVLAGSTVTPVALPDVVEDWLAK